MIPEGFARIPCPEQGCGTTLRLPVLIHEDEDGAYVVTVNTDHLELHLVEHGLEVEVYDGE